MHTIRTHTTRTHTTRTHTTRICTTVRRTLATVALGGTLLATAACGAAGTMSVAADPDPAAGADRMLTIDRIVADLERNAQAYSPSTLDRMVADLEQRAVRDERISTLDRMVLDLERWAATAGD